MQLRLPVFFLFVQSSMFLDEQLGLLSSVSPFSPMLNILNLPMRMLGFNTFVRTQEDIRIPRVAARNRSLIFIYLERSSDGVEVERKSTLYSCAQARNQVMQLTQSRNQLTKIAVMLRIVYYRSSAESNNEPGGVKGCLSRVHIQRTKKRRLFLNWHT